MTDHECQQCDGDGRIWNNADPTSGQWIECECAQGIEAAPAAKTGTGLVHESPVGATSADAPKGSIETLQAQVDALTRALEGMVRTSALAPDSLERAVARMAGEVALSLQRDTD